MGVQYRKTQITAVEIHIVNQQPHAHSRFGGLDKLVGEQPAHQIIVVQVILHIDAAFGITGKHRPANKGVQTVFEE